MNETILMAMLQAIMVIFFVVGLHGDSVRRKREAAERPGREEDHG